MRELPDSEIKEILSGLFMRAHFTLSFFVFQSLLKLQYYVLIHSLHTTIGYLADVLILRDPSRASYRGFRWGWENNACGAMPRSLGGAGCNAPTGNYCSEVASGGLKINLKIRGGGGGGGCLLPLCIKPCPCPILPYGKVELSSSWMVEESLEAVHQVLHQESTDQKRAKGSSKMTLSHCQKDIDL